MTMAALLGLGHSAARNTPPDDPRALTIYQVMVASFQHSPDGAPGYSAMWGPDGNLKSGNLKGITGALDHISSLGANAIWLTPIFDSSTALGGEKLQATGYFTNDYFSIDPHFGTADDLRELVDEAHRRGMYVILDGVFGHHGGVTTPSPSGYTLDSTPTACERADGGLGNVKYPESLDYIKEVATWWIDNFDIDGWRLDQAYQAFQNGHNYWHEIRGAVEETAARRKAQGKQWGTLGYMVGEDWGAADVINHGVYNTGGLKSAFDFDGKELISGPMQDVSRAGLEGGWADVITVLSPPTARGYLNDRVMPNLFLSNHDGYRLADHFDPESPDYYAQLMLRHAILAAYSGPVTLYYGDEFADRSLETVGGQPDNIARTTGHLDPRNEGERQLSQYVARIFNLRKTNPALWRGETMPYSFVTPDGANVLVVIKQDTDSDNRVAVIFSDKDTRVPLEDGPTIAVRANIPEFVVIR